MVKTNRKSMGRKVKTKIKEVSKNIKIKEIKKEENLAKIITEKTFQFDPDSAEIFPQSATKNLVTLIKESAPETLDRIQFEEKPEREGNEDNKDKREVVYDANKRKSFSYDAPDTEVNVLKYNIPTYEGNLGNKYDTGIRGGEGFDSSRNREMDESGISKTYDSGVRDEDLNKKDKKKARNIF
ncbi:MAG: hypothetical protein AABW80_00855 [Nanoarchaeota archaeon]